MVREAPCGVFRGSQARERAVRDSKHNDGNSLSFGSAIMRLGMALGGVGVVLLVDSCVGRERHDGLRGGARPTAASGPTSGGVSADSGHASRLLGALLEGQTGADDDTKTQALAVLAFASFFVFFGVAFEHVSHKLLHSASEKTRPIMDALFAELTTYVGARSIVDRLMQQQVLTSRHSVLQARICRCVHVCVDENSGPR